MVDHDGKTSKPHRIADVDTSSIIPITVIVDALEELTDKVDHASESKYLMNEGNIFLSAVNIEETIDETFSNAIPPVNSEVTEEIKFSVPKLPAEIEEKVNSNEEFDEIEDKRLPEIDIEEASLNVVETLVNSQITSVVTEEAVDLVDPQETQIIELNTSDEEVQTIQYQKPILEGTPISTEKDPSPVSSPVINVASKKEYRRNGSNKSIQVVKANSPIKFEPKVIRTHSNSQITSFTPISVGGTVLKVPCDKVAQIIGSKGAIIQEIQTRTGVTVDVSKESLDGINRSVRLTGNESQIKSASDLIKLILDQGPSAIYSNQCLGASVTTAVIECSMNQVRKVIGTGGSVINEIESQSGAKIQIEQDLPPDVPRKIKISGNFILIFNITYFLHFFLVLYDYTNYSINCH